MKKLAMAVLAVALGTSVFAADEKPAAPVAAKEAFDFHKVMGKTKEEAVKMVEDAGWHALVVMEDGKMLVTKQPAKDEKPTLDLIIAKGKVTGAVLSSAKDE